MRHSTQIDGNAFKALKAERREREDYNDTHKGEKPASFFAILSEAMIKFRERAKQ